ncbi:MAG: hypothetical protein VYC42_08490 [Pseudomonadota bacterium]|nr:hypothetical protein [Pseudomonadota bacterium]
MSSKPLSSVRTSLVVVLAMLGPVCASQASVDESQPDAAMVRSIAIPAAGSGYSRSLATDGLYRVTARFTSFDGDPLHIGFPLAAGAARNAAQGFGIARTELDALVDRCTRSKACNQAALDQHVARYYGERGLRMKRRSGQPTRLFVDVPLAVHRNRAHVQPLAEALRRLATARGRDSRWAVDAAIALVQTGLPYREPGDWDNGRRIVGFYPPARALEQGYGDCDTKSALLAAVLLHLTEERLVGIHVPGHYLLGIAGRPLPGQAHIRHEEQTYVLVEAAGPAMRRPGDVADSTLAALRAGEDIRVDPI